MSTIVVKSTKIRKCLTLNAKLNNSLYDDLMMTGVHSGLYYKVTLRQKGCVFINVLTTNATHCLSSPQNLAHSDTEFVPPISFKLPVINIAAESRVKHPGKKTTQNITHTE